MTRTARRRFRIALLALCTLLLTQWTLAAHACPVAALAAPAQHQQHGQQALPAPELPAIDPLHNCHQAVDADSLQTTAQLADASLCQKHCTDDVPSPAAGVVAIDAPVLAVLRVALPPPADPLPAATATVSGDATAPPLSILYCVFLT